MKQMTCAPIYQMALVLALFELLVPAVASAQDSSWKNALASSDTQSLELRESVVRIAAKDAASRQYALSATIYRPSGTGPFPVAILNHGAPTRAEDRIEMGRYRVLSAISALVHNGFAVLVPMRRGYGTSDGPYSEGFGQCPSARFDETGRESARDILASIEWLKSQSDVDMTSIVLIGQSAGGFASLAAAAAAPAGVVAVVNLSGGRGGNGRTGIPCNVEAMRDVLATYGARVNVPTLWFYVENDKYFGPETARTWFAAWRHAGGSGRLVMHPPHGGDGHLLFYSPDGTAIWIEAMRRHFQDFAIPWPILQRNRTTQQ
jgi:dienelactone hydrolase